jgi:hypothetical protein
MSVEPLEVQQALGCSHAEAVALVAQADRIGGELERQLAAVADVKAKLGIPAVEVGALVLVPVDPNHRTARVTEEAAEGGRWRIDWQDARGAHRWAWWDTDQLTVVAGAHVGAVR